MKVSDKIMWILVDLDPKHSITEIMVKVVIIVVKEITSDTWYILHNRGDTATMNIMETIFVIHKVKYIMNIE